MASRTAFDFSIPLARPILTLDDSENGDIGIHSSEKSKSDKQICLKKHKSNSVSSFIPQSVLLGSLLEHLCSLYESDSERSAQLFNSICKQLEKVHIVSPVTYLEEYASIRMQYKASFYNLIQSAILNLDSKLTLSTADENNTLVQNRLLSSQKPIPSSEVFKLSVSRYEEEFEEQEILGTGAFGKVFKARNKIDGQEYAIKKIRFKHIEREPNQINRMMREVQSLASLQHVNVIRYHHSWMEHRHHDDPNSTSQSSSDKTTSASESPSHHSATNFLDVPNIVQDQEFDVSLNTNSSWGTSMDTDLEEKNANNVSKFWQIGDTDDEEMSVSTNRMSKHKTKESRGVVFAEPDVLPQSSPPSDVILTHGVLREKRMKRVQSVILTKLPQSPLQFSYFNNTESPVVRSRSLNNMQDINILNGVNPKHPINDTIMQSFESEIVLYIQMQICESSLQNWLVERNNAITTLPNASDGIIEEKSFDIFRQILSALDYIHGKEILHRDLKPRNILTNGTRPHILLGDFGLSRPAISRQSSAVLSPIADLPINFELDEHTSGVGTTVYAAPEQLCQENYDFKADMYSLGIIFFELMWPLLTAHQRGDLIKQLRQGKIPQEYATKWPETVDILTSLLSHNPDDRPTAKQLLSEGVFLSQKSRIIAKQNIEIARLQCRNADLETMVHRYRTKLIKLGFDPDLP